MKADILVVDDTPENLLLISTLLQQQGYQVRKALNGQAALIAVQTLPPDLILLDILMPEIDGYTVCQCLKANPATSEIPIIFLSALNEAFDKVKAFRVGGADYITKPFQIEEVLTRVQNQLMLKKSEKVLQEMNAQLEARVHERTRQLELANQELQREIDERKRAEAQLLEMAFYDVLTGLPNRTLLMERLQELLNRGHADSIAQVGLLFLDCDRFKVINDSLGHLVGDDLLIAIARRLESCLNPGDTLARLGGDEFAILLQRADSLSQVTQVAETILKVLSYPFQLKGREIFISASIGVVLSQPEQDQPEHLLRDADAAMYRAKALGKARYEIFDSAMRTDALQRLQIETDLRKAILQQEFTLHYQPIVSLSTGQVAGFEALVRWQHSQQGCISPLSFIPIAEELGLISDIGNWVLQAACGQLRQWQQQSLVDPTLTISVNLSVWQFLQANFIQHIDQILLNTQLSPSNLKLEITESAIMDDTKRAASILSQLRARHIHVSLDDFGTGYSSLSYLHSFPVDSLKIDRSFVQQLETNSKNLELVAAIMSIARAMNMQVVAEGIETQEQLAQLRGLGCGLGQGFWFARPLSAEQTLELLRANPRW